jgi:hypothetical protein
MDDEDLDMCCARRAPDHTASGLDHEITLCSTRYVM